MILTGKAREDFSYKYNMSNFNEYSDVLQNALIIEFFDSVGIIINVGGVLQNGIYSFSFDIQENNTLTMGQMNMGSVTVKKQPKKQLKKLI